MALPWSMIIYNALAILCPLAMAILSQHHGTRYWRVACYPLGVVSAVLAILTLADYVRRTRVPGDTPDSFIALYANSILVYNLSLVGLYAFSNEVYQSHPIPHNVRWKNIRSSRVFTILDIFLSSDRKANYSPNPVRSHRLQRGLSHTLKWAMIHGLLTDFFTLPVLLRNHGLYNEDGTRDLKRWCITLSSESGLSALVIRMGLFGCYAGTVFSGLQGGWEFAKLIGVGTGVWAEEEWIEIMDSPYLSTSMIELWGKRYHQSQFHTILSPFQLPKPIYLLASFMISGLHHVLIMSCLTGQFPFHYAQFFLGCGLVCMVEYSIYKSTGRKVEGITGWVWTISWLFIVGNKSLESEVENGGFEGFRMPVEIFGWSAYPLDHVIRLIKWLKGTV